MCNVNVNFNEIKGNMRLMHCISQPPMLNVNDSLMHYVTEAGILFSRLHDTQGYQGDNRFVDVPNIFRDFDADENDPASYDFAFTDEFLKCMIKAECQPFYRLGVTIENHPHIKAYRIFPPKDPAKWARICEHIIRHYNEGWANGFRFGIRYWEIWNEPDDANFKGGKTQMWFGTPEQFYELYDITACHLKACFGDTISVGGYSACGWNKWQLVDAECQGIDYEPENYWTGRIKFAHGFFKYIKERGTPLDFFSFHSYSQPENAVTQVNYARRLLEKYGFGNVPMILDEWNTNPWEPAKRDSAWASALVMEMMLRMQTETDVDMIMLYDASVGASPYSALINPLTYEPFTCYYNFKMFSDAYRLGKQAKATSDNPALVVCAATNGSKNILLMVNTLDKPLETAITVTGADSADAEIIFTNQCCKNTLTGKRLQPGNLLMIPPYTSVEIRFPAP